MESARHTLGDNRKVWLIFASLLFTPLAVIFTLLAVSKSREYLAYPTCNKLKKSVMAELPIGTDKAEVLAFLDQHKIGHAGYKQIPAQEKEFALKFPDRAQEFSEQNLRNKINQLDYRIYSGCTVSNWGL